MTLLVNQIICGSALEVLKTFPAESVNCCISSPPYWSLRDYGIEGQLGLEKTFEEYIQKLCDIYDEVYQVLRKDGTCWVNLGDTYGGSGCGTNDYRTEASRSIQGIGKNKELYKTGGLAQKLNYADKCLCLIPYRFAIEMVNRGWILRNIIQWHKPNCMPSSADDRFTVDYEPVFFFVKSKKYWFEQQYEPYEESTFDRYKHPCFEGPKHESGCYSATGQRHTAGIKDINPLGRNMRCVWKIPTQPTSDAHFATFPEELVRPMIKAGCPRYVCSKCEKARAKIIEIEGRIGLTDCGCGAEFKGGIVLDPFCGTATVCKISVEEGRDFIGIDLNPKYVSDFALPKVKAVETGVSVVEQRQGMKGLFEDSKTG